MSRVPHPRPDRVPLIALIDKAHRALQNDMVHAAQRGGYPQVKPAHNAVFATLPASGARATDMAARAGITRQSMGEVIREMVSLGILEMKPDPDDRRAKLVTYTAEGLVMAGAGYGHIVELEQRLADDVGDREYEAVRDFLAWLPSALDDGKDLSSG